MINSSTAEPREEEDTARSITKFGRSGGKLQHTNNQCLCSLALFGWRIACLPRRSFSSLFVLRFAELYY